MHSTSLHEFHEFHEFTHQPVMLQEVFDALSPALQYQDSVYYDLTLGLGGHTEYFLENLSQIQAVGIDRDTDAIARATSRLANYADRFESYHARYDDISKAVSKTGKQPNAILMDLGVSSMQLDNADRGFAYSSDQALDMRMDQNSGFSAAEFIESVSEEDLASIIRKYSDERYSRQIASQIKRDMPTTTHELADSVRRALPASIRRGKQGMSAIKRVFQAVRIAVNNEFESLEKALPNAINELKKDGIIGVLTYHSLEENIVKHEFNLGTQNHINSQIPRELPVNESTLSALSTNSITYLETVKAPKKPSDAEIARNPRAKSARFRVMRKVADTELRDGVVYGKK